MDKVVPIYRKLTLSEELTGKIKSVRIWEGKEYYRLFNGVELEKELFWIIVDELEDEI